MSFKDYIVSLREKMLRDPLSPQRVAAGWALGMFVGCSIPFGFQLIVSIPLALAMKVSKVGATIGTFVTNPVTIWIIYPVQTWLVNQAFFGGTLGFSHLMHLEWTWPVVRALGVDAMLSFLIGGLFLALLFTPLTYLVVLCVVKRHRKMV